MAVQREGSTVRGGCVGGDWDTHSELVAIPKWAGHGVQTEWGEV